MRTLSNPSVVYLRDAQSAEFGCPQEPLPDKIRISLWLVDGAERRHGLARQWSGQEPNHPRAINAAFDQLGFGLRRLKPTLRR
jgi:hypothetical protein